MESDKVTSKDETKPAISAEQIEIPGAQDTRRTLKVEPPQTGADPMRSRRGRPRKIDGSSRRNPDRQVVGEVEFRKPASEINNLHAAFDRIIEQEKALHTRKVELAGQYENEYGKKLRVVEPTHMLDAKTAAEKIPAAQGKALATALYAAPAALLGIEVRPKPDELAMLGDAIVDLSKFYSFADNEAMTWLAVGFAALACFAPAAAELRSKKAGTWETDKIALANAGYLPGARP